MTDDEFQSAVQAAVAAEVAEQKLIALHRLRASVLSERRILRVLTVIAIAVGCVGVYLAWDASLVAATAQDAADTAERTLDAFERSIDESQVSACEQENLQQQRNIDANKQQIREVFASLTDGDTLDASEQEALDRLFARHDAVIVAAYPMRICTPGGIEAFFDDDPGTDPYVPAPQA